MNLKWILSHWWKKGQCKIYKEKCVLALETNGKNILHTQTIKKWTVQRKGQCGHLFEPCKLSNLNMEFLLNINCEIQTVIAHLTPVFIYYYSKVTFNRIFLDDGCLRGPSNTCVWILSKSYLGVTYTFHTVPQNIRLQVQNI